MRLWRISNFKDLSGEGGRRSEGRWHPKGIPVVYLAEHPALALLERIVHLEIDPADLPSTYKLLTIDAPDGLKCETIGDDELDKKAAGWRASYSVSQKVTEGWFANKRTALFCVPSVLVPGRNYLLNPLHPDARLVTVLRDDDLEFDKRLFGSSSPIQAAS
jgi:RES domain-containing protein